MPADLTARSPFAARRTFMLAALFVLALCAAVWADDLLTERRQRIEAMSIDEKDRLLRKYERFRALDAAEQQRLRTLQAQIDASPDADELLRVMHAYHEWLKSLSPGQRSELLEADPEERIAEIRRLRAEQQRQAESRLGLHDVLALLGWVEEQFEERLLESSSSRRRGRLNELPPMARRAAMVDLVIRRARDADRGGSRMLSEENIGQLAQRLTDPLRTRLANAESSEDKQRIVIGWLWQLSRQFANREFGSLLDDISEEELTQFFEQELSPETRERLLMMPPDEMWRRLRIEYLRSELPSNWTGRSRSRSDSGRDGDSRDGTPRHGGSREGGSRRGPPRRPPERP